MANEFTPSYIDVDKLYQDEMVGFLGSIPVGKTISLGFVDGKDIASALLGAASQGAERFLSIQSELVYGDPATTRHARPNITTEATLLNYLDEAGFKVELAQGGGSLPGWRNVLATKTQEQRVTKTAIGQSDLPTYTDGFYPVSNPAGSIDRTAIRRLLPLPRVLNIGSGSDEAKQLPHAVNIDISPAGKPDIVASGYELPFQDGSFTVVMASHVLEHFPPSDIPKVLNEWLRVLHPKGLLRIAVPDGNMALAELRDGVTHKGLASYVIPGGSAPLTQLLGLGAEHSLTDPRWRHQVLFTRELLEAVLSNSGLVELSDYREDEALSHLCDIHMDETNLYSLKLEALRRRESHKVLHEITESEYQELRDTITWGKAAPISIIIPVHNEQEGLPIFLDQLSGTIKELDSLGLDYEVIFVLNGCTDQSPTLVQQFADPKDHRVKITESDKGIMNAFIKGIKERNKDGSIAKIDVDTRFDYWALPLMIRELLSDKRKQVTYAEVRPLEDEPNRFNMAEFYQEFRTTRNYYHGRFSLYRSNPFEYFPQDLVGEANVLVEDMILSCLYAYYFGLDSMGSADGAFVRSAQPTSFDMDIRKFDRCKTEIDKIERVFPQLRILSSVMKRVATKPDQSGADTPKTTMWSAYHDLHNAMTKISKLSDGVTSEVSEWERLR